MTQELVLQVFQQALLLILKLAAPMLLTSICVGLFIAVFQAATQIHEQTLTFVPKLLTIALMLFFCGSWMISTMRDFVHWLYGVALLI